MAEPRRRRAATAEKLTRLLDATEEIILRQGYAAVSSRAVAARVAINAPLVHYYFPTIDDLFVAVLKRRAEQTLERMAAALASAQPLRGWWELVSDPRGTALTVELIAAANHRPALRGEVGKVAYEVRRMQVETLSSILGEYGLDADEFPPVLIAATMQGLAFAVVADSVAGYDTAPEEAAAAMSRLVARLEERRASRRA
ncbi:TetR/AcrR family transcriptional regulator [Frankia sp. CNm7]|uniref:TetR/AcrR family transcriptional regulator n=1 Tax=Frankia nepalensis TaxID=1836974 RepID=A0A937RBQ1_9ACTN|nr:TetR/AcrR family transcriptional regulator [Frankia nepalensis]MBL7499024.1 TetR/AcrR family transcriptional regulator [Frankia nepalensis]MBL7510166.1 TetR/AcrR family transcriptional regulator [Frankia nepalensis]MBL7519315.1 TetR/AcrR family transcriptional regulator [Frankia nepalensis]MBL7626050.1 TetR/AcrR family transcriptional regulator [Frankia nepalensis]